MSNEVESTSDPQVGHIMYVIQHFQWTSFFVSSSKPKKLKQ